MRVVSTIKHGVPLADIDKLTDNDVLHINDQGGQQYVDFILKKGIPNCIINDHYATPHITSPVPCYALPLLAECAATLIGDGMKIDNNISTTNCFNFVINRKQINRHLCIKFVEYFKLTDFDYTWSADERYADMGEIISELDQIADPTLKEKILPFILTPIELEKKFVECTDNEIEKSWPEVEFKHSIKSFYFTGGIKWSWDNVVQDLISKTAITLIPESIRFEKAAIITEKTLFSVFGLTFPIWVGGYNQASVWQNMGFDIFDDIIDHSYQSYDTLIERCYYAFSNNLELLADVNKSAALRLENKDRLLKNRELLLQNRIGDFIDQEISKYPLELQSVMPEILNYFR